MNKAVKLRAEIEHKLNPLHIYCRLVKIGIDRRLALQLSRIYEQTIFATVRGSADAV